jgi:O-succinylbenzoate synthase
MRVQGVRLQHVRVPLNEPFRISSGDIVEKEAILVELVTDEGTGWGESSPLGGAVYSEDSPESCWRALRERLIPLILSERLDTIERLHEILARVPGEHFAKAGLETAWWDCEAKRQDVPLWKLLGGSQRPIPSGLAVGLYDTTEELLDRIARFLPQGYRRVKIKIKQGYDVSLVEAIRRRFGPIPLFVDANCDYELKHIDVFRELDRFDLMMYEQPFAKGALKESAELQRQIRTPVCLDESIETLEDAERAISLGSCRIVNIKVQRVGGLWPARRIHDLCRSKGIPVWCGTMPELGWGQTQGLALATLDNFLFPADLEPSQRFFTDDIIEPFIQLDAQGCIPVSDQAGTGVRLDMAKIEKYLVRREEFLA